ncbi:uncharacterized protein LOC116590306 [Mustela erminea]|uniref:uncharacterized protein LOC116590306 n=1 Tax=Mustela erminea TaxID=36723 RepID=UPI001386A8A3|nr:uncharacterized protein LOC116590306 [Mustela erminea]
MPSPPPEVCPAGFPSLPRGWSEIPPSCLPSPSQFLSGKYGPSHTGSQSSIFLERQQLLGSQDAHGPQTRAGGPAGAVGGQRPWRWAPRRGQSRGPSPRTSSGAARARPGAGKPWGRSCGRVGGDWTLTEGSRRRQWPVGRPVLPPLPLVASSGSTRGPQTPVSGAALASPTADEEGGPETEGTGAVGSGREPCAHRGMLKPWGVWRREVCWRVGDLPPHTEAVGVLVPGPHTVQRLLVQHTGRRDEGLEAGGGGACVAWEGVLAREARRCRGTEQPFSWAESGEGGLTSWAGPSHGPPRQRVMGSLTPGKPITQHKAFLQRGVSLASGSGADPLGRPAPSPSGSGPGWVPWPNQED